jgi:hypothetical protein
LWWTVLVFILLGKVKKIIHGGVLIGNKDFNSYFWLDTPNKYVASMHPYGPSVAPTKP